MPGTQSSGATSEDQGSRKRRKTNITLACRTCREKRTKCDGQVICKVCQLYDRECIYDRDKDRRRPATKDYVAALEDRIRQLEGHRPTSLSPIACTVSPQSNLLTGQQRNSNYSTVHYGPTSTYMHLEEPVPPSEPSGCLSGTRASLGRFDWSINWQRDLPQHPYLTVDLHRVLLSVFFSYANGWCHWLDESSFLNGLATSATMDHPLRNSDYSPFLHNVVLAFGCLSMARDDQLYPATQVLAPLFAQTASQMKDAEITTPLTTTSRGLMLLGSYYFFNSQRNLGWMTAGMGARVGQILGLNISPGTLLDNSSLNLQTHEHRVRVFWTGFIQDVFMNLNVGRRPALSVSDFNIELPVISATEDAEAWYDHHTRLSPAATSEPGWISTAFHWSAKLALIASDVYHNIYSVRGQDMEKTEQCRTRIELDITAWLAGCPAALHPEYWQGRPIPPHIINVLAAAHHVRILLHRPTCYAYHTTDATYRTKAVDICLSAARQILQLVLISTTRSNTCYILSNALFAAGTTFLLVATRNESSRQVSQKASSDSDECVRLMLGFPTAASRVGHDILQRLCNEWKAPSENLQIRATNKEEAVKLLNDANSDMVKLLTELGWQRPATSIPALENGAVPVEPDALFSSDCFQNPVSRITDIETYDPLGWPDWFMNDLSDTATWSI